MRIRNPVQLPLTPPSHPMNQTKILALTFSIALTACAQAPSQPEAPVKPVAEALKPPPRAVTQPPPRTVPLPKLALSEDLLFKITLAEVAVQRGQPHVAVPALLEVARETKDPRVARRATEIAWNARFMPAALEAASLWLQADPQSSRARQTLIALLVNQQRLDEAQPHLEKWLAADPPHIGQNFLQLSTLMAGHQDKAAVLRLLRTLAAPYPQVPEASLAVAQAAWNASDQQGALDASRQALKLRPDWELAALFQAQALQRSSTEEASAYLGAFVKANPGARDVRLNYARLLVSERKYPEARKQFEILLGEAPNNAEIAMAVATLSMQARDYAAADVQLRRALEIGYKDPDAVRMYLGQVSEELKRDDDALKWYAGVAQGAQFVPAQARYAAVLAKQGKLTEARRHLQAVEAADERQRTQLILAEAGLLRDAGAFQEAFDFLGKAVASKPDSTDLLYDHAMAAEKIDRIDVLEANLRKVIAMQPTHAHAYNALGYTLADRNQRLPEALALIEKAHQLAPEDPFILDSLGWVLHRLGRNAEALGHLQRSFALRPDGEIAAHLGEVLWLLGRQDEARKLWADALREHPKNEVLQGTVKRLAPRVLQSAQ